MKIGEQVFYRMTEDESKANNYQNIAPAMIVAVFENEYVGFGERTGDEATGLNLKIFTDGEPNLLRRSVMMGKEPGQYFLKLENSNIFINVKIDDFVSDSTSHVS